MEKRKRKWNGMITLPILNSLLHHTLEDDVYVDGESFAMLLEIQRTLAVFEPTWDDEARMIWLEIPRGTAEEWKAFDDEHNWYSDPDDDSNQFLKVAIDAIDIAHLPLLHVFEEHLRIIKRVGMRKHIA